MNGQSRRLAAVWFADIVGFTALASRDEGAAFRLVKLFEQIAREEIDRHAGTLVKFMGDGALAIFGGTAAAVDAALSLRDGFRQRTEAERDPSTLRIGVHLGDIIVSDAGDVYGDGVNTAARLQGEADPGQVVVSQDVWRQCRQRAEYRFRELGSRQLKGLAEAERLFVVASAEATTEDADAPPLPWQARVNDSRALAVLPFENLSGTKEADSLAAGLHNDLLTELSKISELTVISRTSVRGYTGTDKPMSAIARELGVGTVVEGTVQSAGDRVRLNVQLIDARLDTQRWAERYDRELTTENLFDIQNELTDRIIRSLRAEIVGKRQARPAKRPTGDLEAFRLAAEGRTHLDRRTESGMRRAVELFRRAVERDPEYAQAWVGFADALLLLMAYGYESPDRFSSRAEDATRRALELAPDLAEAYEARGLLHTVHQEGPEAIRDFEKAVELRPGYAEAHNRLSWHHLLLGHDPALALESARRSVELNPLSAEALCNLSLSYLADGDGDRALAEARRAVELSPGYGTVRFYEALSLYHLERFEEAMGILEQLDEVWAGAGPMATYALAQLASGREMEARRQIDRLEGTRDFFALGLVYAALGDLEDAFAAFQRVDRVWYWPALAVHHYYGEVWAPLRSDPRYDELLEMVKRSWGVVGSS
ncbi:MAG: adenylate/guanylate cyclase domain-containing protein [Longimicrobiaceae bacterium]